MQSKVTPASSTPAERSTIMSYFKFWPIFSMAAFSSTGRNESSADCGSRQRWPAGPRSGTYQASSSFQVIARPTISAQRGHRLVVSRSMERIVCRGSCWTSQSSSSGVSTTWQRTSVRGTGVAATGRPSRPASESTRWTSERKPKRRKRSASRGRSIRPTRPPFQSMGTGTCRFNRTRSRLSMASGRLSSRLCLRFSPGTSPA